MQRLTKLTNIPEEIISIWQKEEGEELLEVQTMAIEEFKLLDGASLLLTAPSSCGKTFVGELAAIAS